MYLLLTITLLLWEQVGCINIYDLQVPGHAAEGGVALLGCQFDLEGEELYSVKWYKDGREFYRYVPSNSETISSFPVPGVIVDVSRSSSNVVALDRLSRESAGIYRCEVSGEAPYFVTVYDEKSINIHLLPRHGPRIKGLQTEYQVGDTLSINCTSPRSRPRAQIKWLVNGQPAPEEYVRGPWVRISRERPDAQDTILGLSFMVAYDHFVQDVLILQCQASIAPLYQNEVVHKVQRVEAKPIDDSDDIGILDFSHTNFVISPTSDEVEDNIVADTATVFKLSMWTLIFSLFYTLL